MPPFVEHDSMRLPKRIFVPVYVFVYLLSSARYGNAQTSSLIAAKDSLRLSAVKYTRGKIPGRVISVTSDSVLFRYNGGEGTRWIRTDSIQTIDRWVSHHPRIVQRTRNGAVWGAVAGFIAGEGVGYLAAHIPTACGPNQCAPQRHIQFKIAAAGTLTGGFLGALLGLSASGDQWLRVYPVKE